VLLNANASYTLRQAHVDWLARAQGGAGCWDAAGAVTRADVVWWVARCESACMG
jgi:hypothetical protein